MLFGKQKKLPCAYAFVDFEHWYISYTKHFNIKPNIKEWYNEICSKYDVQELHFFADFSENPLRAELDKIRDVTHSVIDTKASSAYYKKDFTDFIMLDYIYRTAMTAKKADTFILFTGDGHFSTAVRFLTNECKKKVVVYGVTNAMSNQLRACSTECYEVPTDAELFGEIYKLIIDNFNYIYSHPEMKIIPTYKSIIENLTKRHNRKSGEIEAALKQMIEKNYVYQDFYQVERYKKVKVLKPNWELLKRDGFYQK